MKSIRYLCLCGMLLSLLLFPSFLCPPLSAAGSGGDRRTSNSRQRRGRLFRIIRRSHLGVDPTFVPYEFIDSDGLYKGIAADYIALICEKDGLEAWRSRRGLLGRKRTKRRLGEK